MKIDKFLALGLLIPLLLLISMAFAVSANWPGFWENPQLRAGFFFFGLAMIALFVGILKLGSPLLDLANSEKSNEAMVLKVVLSLFATVFGIFCVAFIWWNGFKLSRSVTDWGATGDFVGGIMNPIISVAVLFLVLRTYQIQKEELKQFGEELKHSRENQKAMLELTALQAEVAAQTALYEAAARNVEYIQAEMQSVYGKPDSDVFFGPGGQKSSKSEYLIYCSKSLHNVHAQSVAAKAALAISLDKLKSITGSHN